MIQTDYGLETTQRAVADLEAALRGLTSKKAKYHPTTFALLAEPLIDAIREFRAEIDDYIGNLPADHPRPAPAVPAVAPAARNAEHDRADVSVPAVTP